MEQKLLKTNVYTANKIFEGTAEIAVDGDFMLPEALPDITRVLKCRAATQIAATTVSGGTVTAEGSVQITVLYCNENRLFAFEQNFPFAKSFEIGSASEGVLTECCGRVAYMNCRAVTGRKVDVHGAVELCLKVTERKSVEILADYDDPTVALRRSAVPAVTPMGFAEKYVTLEDEITVGQGQPEICALLRYDAEAAVNESKLLNGKNIVKGELVLCLLYAPEAGKPQTVRAALPFSQLLEIVGTTDDCTCDTTVRVAGLTVKPKQTPMGDCRSFSVTAKLSLCSKAYCDRSVELITDAYSRKCEIRMTSEEVPFRHIDRALDEVCRCQDTFEFPGDLPVEITDLCCEVQTVSTRFGENDLTVSGTVLAGLTVCDGNGCPQYYEKPIEFSCKYPAENTENPACDPAVTVRNCTYTMTGDKTVEIRVELGVRGAVTCGCSCRLLTGLQEDTDRPLPKEDRGAMTLYFGEVGENVWEIARRYRADADEIRKLNEVGETLESRRMIMIPMNG